jgi:hypothetical protein
MTGNPRDVFNHLISFKNIEDVNDQIQETNFRFGNEWEKEIGNYLLFSFKNDSSFVEKRVLSFVQNFPEKRDIFQFWFLLAVRKDDLKMVDLLVPFQDKLQFDFALKVAMERPSLACLDRFLSHIPFPKDHIFSTLFPENGRSFSWRSFLQVFKNPILGQQMVHLLEKSFHHLRNSFFSTYDIIFIFKVEGFRVFRIVLDKIWPLRTKEHPIWEWLFLGIIEHAISRDPINTISWLEVVIDFDPSLLHRKIRLCSTPPNHLLDCFVKNQATMNVCIFLIARGAKTTQGFTFANLQSVSKDFPFVPLEKILDLFNGNAKNDDLKFTFWNSNTGKIYNYKTHRFFDASSYPEGIPLPPHDIFFVASCMHTEKDGLELLNSHPELLDEHGKFEDGKGCSDLFLQLSSSFKNWSSEAKHFPLILALNAQKYQIADWLWKHGADIQMADVLFDNPKIDFKQVDFLFKRRFIFRVDHEKYLPKFKTAFRLDMYRAFLKVKFIAKRGGANKNLAFLVADKWVSSLKN